MSLIPPAVVGVPAATAATASGAPADGELAGAFAALVEALTAQLAAGETQTETVVGPGAGADGDPLAEPGAEAEAEVAVTAAGAATVLATWPMPLQGIAGQPVDADAAAPTTEIGPELLVRGDAVDVEPGAGTSSEALAAELPDGAAEGATAEPASSPTEAPDVPIDGSPAAHADADVAADPAGDAATGDPAGEPATADGSGDAPLADADPSAAVPTARSATSDAAAARPAGAVTAAAPTPPSGEAAATTARAAAPALPTQLVEVVAPLRRGPDGTHQVAIQLRPDELGEVVVDVRVRGNEVALSLRADLAGTADLLRESLGELRAELEAAGFRAGDLDVGSQAERRSPREASRVPGGASSDRAGTPSAGPDHQPVPATPLGVAGLDLRL